MLCTGVIHLAVGHGGSLDDELAMSLKYTTEERAQSECTQSIYIYAVDALSWWVHMPVEDLA